MGLKLPNCNSGNPITSKDTDMEVLLLDVNFYFL